METYIANFILAPSNRYVGWIVYNNGYFFGSGNTITRMIRNIKQVLYKIYGNRKWDIVLASKSTPKEEVPLHKMAKKFQTLSYFGHKLTDRLTKDQKVVWNRSKPKTSVTETPVTKTPKPKSNKAEYLCKEVNGEMVIYEIKEVARYKIFNRKDFALKEYLCED